MKKTKYKVSKEKVDGEYRAVLYADNGDGFRFVRDLDLHSQLTFEDAKQTLLKYAS